MSLAKPCETCTRTKRPASCGNIYCEDWREWFARSWNEACARIRKMTDESSDNPQREQEAET